MNIKKISAAALTAAVAAAVLRVLQFLVFFDQSTGFFVDNGVISAIAIIAAFLVPAEVFILPSFRKRSYGRVKFCRSVVMGTGSLVCGALMTIGVKLLHDDFISTGSGAASSAMGLSFYGPFIFMTMAMVLFLIISSIAWLSGKPLFETAKPLYLIAVLWSLSLILYVFIHHSISVLNTENVLMALLSCSLAVALMAQARFFADLNPQGKSLRLLVPTTLLSASMSLYYSVSGIVTYMAGVHTKNEAPIAFELIILAVGIYMFLMLRSISYVPLAVPIKPKMQQGKRYKVDIKRDL